METALLLLLGLSGGTRHIPLQTVGKFVTTFGVFQGRYRRRRGTR